MEMARAHRVVGSANRNVERSLHGMLSARQMPHTRYSAPLLSKLFVARNYMELSREGTQMCLL